MGRIACQHADVVFVTSDNPRLEKPSDIINDILKGFDHFEKVYHDEDRKKSILKAIQISNCHDIVLIAGKGHEEYQEIGNQKIYFSDKNVVREFLME